MLACELPISCSLILAASLKTFTNSFIYWLNVIPVKVENNNAISINTPIVFATIKYINDFIPENFFLTQVPKTKPIIPFVMANWIPYIDPMKNPIKIPLITIEQIEVLRLYFKYNKAIGIGIAKLIIVPIPGKLVSIISTNVIADIIPASTIDLLLFFSSICSSK